MKTLVVYYSFTQNNEKLAQHLQQRLHCDIVQIEPVKKRNRFSIFLDLMFNRKPAIKPVPYYLRDYDHIIFAAPIWAGKIAMPLKTFLMKERNNIRHYSFVTLCGGGSAEQKSRITKELAGLIGQRPEKVVELWISQLLIREKDNVIEYRIDPARFRQFEKQISELMRPGDVNGNLSRESLSTSPV